MPIHQKPQTMWRIRVAYQDGQIVKIGAPYPTQAEAQVDADDLQRASAENHYTVVKES